MGNVERLPCITLICFKTGKCEYIRVNVQLFNAPSRKCEYNIWISKIERLADKLHADIVGKGLPLVEAPTVLGTITRAKQVRHEVGFRSTKGGKPR